MASTSTYDLHLSETQSPVFTGRFSDVSAKFKDHFSGAPDFVARAPGRVNLIGEHIDYCGYAVFPMAIQQDTMIAVRITNTATISMANTNALLYCPISVPSCGFDIDKDNPQWYHYVLCGVRGVMEHFSQDSCVGMEMLVDGNIPPNAGLSSSSALVCCSALAAMQSNGKSLSRTELASICAQCENYIGTIGGGMDQAISFLAETGSAKLIEFLPELKATNVSLPSGVEFVIANSCVEKCKSQSADFNIRVVECRLSCQVIAKAKNLDWKHMQKLGLLQQALGVSLDDMLNIVDSVLQQQTYSKDEICQILAVTADELNDITLNQNTFHVEQFNLHARAKHVFSEAGRVLKFKQICEQDWEDARFRLGQLMCDSHVSCRDLYECSCDELNNLIGICMQSGALGSRLTGAGWGGCCVSMVESNNVSSFIENVTSLYYSGNEDWMNRIQNCVFSTQPSTGAFIYKM